MKAEKVLSDRMLPEHRKKLNCSDRGATLIELMISLAITGIITLAAAALLTRVTQLQVKSSNESSNAEDLSLFNQFLHQYIDQSVMFYCNCTSSPTCYFDPTWGSTKDACDLGRQFVSANAPDCASNTAGVAPVPVVLAAFVTETAPNPLSVPGAQCYMPANWSAGVTPSVSAKGCKKVIQLVYTRASRADSVAGGLASQPGVLELRDVTAFMNTKSDIKYFPLYNAIATAKTIASLRDVSVAKCGLTVDLTTLGASNQSTMSGFQLNVNLKILGRRVISTTKNNESGVSSYNPADADFVSGNAITRVFQDVYSFKNIDQRGRMFGPTTTRPCLATGQASADWRDCCTSHLDSITGSKCSDTCSSSGTPGMTNEGQCCSKMLRSGTSVCL